MGIEIINVNKFVGKPPTQILKKISLYIPPGDFVALCGRSGSGKSTLLYLLGGLDRPSSGQIKINGQDIHAMSTKNLNDFKNKEIGFVFQNYYLISELSALENVLMPAMKNNQHKRYKNEALILLKKVGLEQKINRLPSELSGGEQQRVAIVRALLMAPKYLFADEPTGNLDSINSGNIIELMRKINLERHTTIVLVTHDVDFASTAKRQIYLSDGMIVT